MLSRFYLIVDTADGLDDFLALGVTTVQLRIKGAGAPGLRGHVRAARDACARHGATLIVNDHWRLALDEGCDAVHLGQEDLDGADIAALKREGTRLGISTHDRAELARALALAPDYVALGPIHATLLKEMPWRPQGLDKLARWKAAVGELPLVAIGGFTPERAAAAFAHGADSVCVVTDVARHPEPLARVAEWLETTRTGSAAAPRAATPARRAPPPDRPAATSRRPP